MIRPRTNPRPDDPLSLLEDLRSELRQVLLETATVSPRVRIDPYSVTAFYGEVAEFERSLIIAALAIANGQQKKAAKLLHLSPSTLCTKIKALEIDLDQF